MHLNLFLHGTGHHEASWRHPAATIAYAETAQNYIDSAITAERAKLDSVFLSDGLCGGVDLEHSMPRNFEPLTLLGAIAVNTRSIGLVGTTSTTFSEPYNVARQFGSLDHLSNGRAGWNIVTTAENRAARNFGLPMMPTHEERYGRAREFVDVVRSLWDSWADDAVLADAASGRYADPDRIQRIRHQGTHFRVAGALNMARSPQGHPILVQAGASSIGQDFAAAYAEIVFTVQRRLTSAQTFYNTVKERACAYGRDPALVKVLPGIVPIIGDTEANARNRHRELNELIVMERAVAGLEERLNISLSGHDLDTSMPPIPPVTAFRGQQGRYRLIKEMAEWDKLTVREIIHELAAGRGHLTVVGTAEQVADTMQEWHARRAADGFTVLPPLLPEGIDLFAEQVVPELQRRGLFRNDYAGSTMRDHYGLPRPGGRGTQAGGMTSGRVGAAVSSRAGQRT